ncbi:MAG: hypothetical protein PHN18_12360 [Sulfurospirillaceae bacterium]|nr:hypothetical protein [Sulfurospirillaceae bacterium]MDD2826313.1 hypothetical protein [Sulfurospirillaceae bacterium]
MNSKKFTIRFLYIIIFPYIALYILYFVVNPEQIFKSSITEKKFFYTKEFSRKQFEMLKTNESILIFGTSQSHMLSTEMLNQKVLNFHNLYSEPGDIINFLYQLNQKQIHNIKEIIYLIDLRAGATREDSNLINYSAAKIIYPLSLNSIKRLFLDIRFNTLSKYENFLNKDGSIKWLNSTKHIQNINEYTKNTQLKFNDRLIQRVLDINQFCIKNNINIRYITSVTNEKFFKKINLDEVEQFSSSLLKGGIVHLGLFYYIDGISNLKNKNGHYIAFMEKEHLNQYYVEKWVHNYILKENEYTIKNLDDLKHYIQRMHKLQQKLREQ